VKDPVKEWLPQRAAAAGVLASGLRRPNGRLGCQCSDASCPPAVMENLMRQLDSSRTLHSGEKLPPRWVTYCFDHGLIRFVVRADGWQFAAVVRPETDAAQQLDELSAEFLTLPIK
jgi:hypothetical protein